MKERGINKGRRKIMERRVTGMGRGTRSTEGEKEQTTHQQTEKSPAFKL